MLIFWNLKYYKSIFRRMVLNIITSSIPQEYALALLAAKETSDLAGDKFADRVEKELARIGNVDISHEQAAIDYAERRQKPGENKAPLLCWKNYLTDIKQVIHKEPVRRLWRRRYVPTGGSSMGILKWPQSITTSYIQKQNGMYFRYTVGNSVGHIWSYNW